MRGRVFAVLVGALAVVLVAAGCGGGGSDPLTKSEFTKQGNAICKHSEEERNANPSEAAKEVKGGSAEEELETFITEGALPSIQEMTDELAGLGVPKGDEKEVEAIIAAFEEATEKLEADPQAALSGTSFDKANKLAESYGLTDCGI